MPSIDWKKLIDLQYWLEGIAGNTASTPIIEQGTFFFWFYLYLFSIFLVLGIVLRVSQAFLHTDYPLQRRFPIWGNNFVWMGVLGLVWFLLRQLSVGFLGARIWVLVGLVWFLVIAYFIVRYFILFYKLEIAYFRKQQLVASEKKKK